MADGTVGMIATPAERRHPGRLHVDPTCTAPRGRRCPDDSHHASALVWCADNSCFGANYPGDDAWLAWLEHLATERDRCWFATAPDVVHQTPEGPVGDAAATLARSEPLLPLIRALGYPAALVAQDGLEYLEVPWDAFDVLFLGGSTEWKLGSAAARLAAEAKVRGKGVHMGRVNSGVRWAIAELFACDSADGTFLAFGPDKNLERMTAWSSTPSLYGGAA